MLFVVRAHSGKVDWSGTILHPPFARRGARSISDPAQERADRGLEETDGATLFRLRLLTGVRVTTLELFLIAGPGRTPSSGLQVVASQLVPGRVPPQWAVRGAEHLPRRIFLQDDRFGFGSATACGCGPRRKKSAGRQESGLVRLSVWSVPL